MNGETVDRVNWNKVLARSEMQKAAIDFSLGILSRDSFYQNAIWSDVGGIVRNFVRNRGAINARMIARKALKRRRLLTKRNLINPVVYAQL